MEPLWWCSFLLGLLSCQLLLLVLLGWLGLVNLWCHWFSAQFGNWHCCSAVLMCWSSLSSLSCEEETTLALCASVLNTLCLAVMWWLLSECRYWSCVELVSCRLRCWRCCLVLWWPGYLRMEVSLVVLVPLWTGYVGPGCWCVVEGSDCVLPCWWQRCHLQTLAIGKGEGVELRAFTSNSSIKMLAMRGLMGDP